MAKQKLKHIMLDHETLGTRADSVIISIGAVKFDPTTAAMENNGFYASVSIDSNTEAGRHISEDTLIWWMKQSPEAQKVFTEPKIALAPALDEFIDWVGPGDDFVIWSNGADFDIPMMNHALATHGLTPPWKFWNQKCYRTMKELPSAKKAAKPERFGHHNALSDAIYQAQHLQNIFAEMNK